MPETARIRIVLADDHRIVLHGLQRLFEQNADMEVVAACNDGAEAIAAVAAKSADILILDLRMPGQSGIDVLRQLAAARSTCRVVLLTAALRDAEAAEVVRLGAKGLVLKESSPETLLDCVRRVHRGEQWFDRPTMAGVAERSERPNAGRVPTGASLTARELEIVRMVAQGLRNREIGTRLTISEGTVKIHLHNTYEKLGVDGRLELLLYAQDRGLI